MHHLLGFLKPKINISALLIMDSICIIDAKIAIVDSISSRICNEVLDSNH